MCCTRRTYLKVQVSERLDSEERQHRLKRDERPLAVQNL